MRSRKCDSRPALSPPLTQVARSRLCTCRHRRCVAKMSPDVFYCMVGKQADLLVAFVLSVLQALLDATGVVVVPGSGFGQVE